MMKMRMTKLIAATLVLAAQPASGAELIGDGTPVAGRTSAFAGGTLRFDLRGGTKKLKPDARLRLGFAHQKVVRGVAADDLALSGLSLASGRKGKVALFLGRMELTDPEQKLGLSTGGAIAIGAGVTLLALVALAAAAGPPEIGCGLADDPDDC